MNQVWLDGRLYEVRLLGGGLALHRIWDGKPERPPVDRTLLERLWNA